MMNLASQVQNQYDFAEKNVEEIRLSFALVVGTCGKWACCVDVRKKELYHIIQHS